MVGEELLSICDRKSVCSPAVSFPKLCHRRRSYPGCGTQSRVVEAQRGWWDPGLLRGWRQTANFKLASSCAEVTWKDPLHKCFHGSDFFIETKR